MFIHSFFQPDSKHLNPSIDSMNTCDHFEPDKLFYINEYKSHEERVNVKAIHLICAVYANKKIGINEQELDAFKSAYGNALVTLKTDVGKVHLNLNTLTAFDRNNDTIMFEFITKWEVDTRFKTEEHAKRAFAKLAEHMQPWNIKAEWLHRVEMDDDDDDACVGKRKRTW